MTRRRVLLPTAQAAAAVGRPAATLREWAHRGLIQVYGTPRQRRYDLREVQAVHDELRTRKIAGHHARLARWVRDTLPTDVDSGLDNCNARSLSVVPRVPDDLEERAGDYGTFGPATPDDGLPGLSAS